MLKLDISHHAIERYISRVDRMATREQAMRAIREAWRGARRLHGQPGGRAIYDVHGGAFRLSAVLRDHDRMAILSVLPGDATEDEEPSAIAPAPEPAKPINPRRVIVESPATWRHRPKLHEPVQAPSHTAFEPPSSLEEAKSRRTAALARQNAIQLQLSALPPKHSMRTELTIDRQRETNEVTQLNAWIHDEHVTISDRVHTQNLYAAWKLLHACRAYVPAEMVAAIEREIPPGFDPTRDLEREDES